MAASDTTSNSLKIPLASCGASTDGKRTLERRGEEIFEQPSMAEATPTTSSPDKD